MAPAPAAILPIQRAYPSINPLDHYRIAIAQELSRIEPAINVQLAFDSLDRTRDLAHGDLVLALPRLRLQCDPTELGKKLVSEVRFPEFGRAVPSSNDVATHCLVAGFPATCNELFSPSRLCSATRSTLLST